MLIQAEFYYLIDTEPTVHPKHIHIGTIHTMLQEWKVFPLWETLLSWREKMIITLPITTTCSSPAPKRAMKAFPWLLETISKAKPRWGWGGNGMGREGMKTPVYLSPNLLIVLVICLSLVLVSVGQNAYRQTLTLFIQCLWDTSIRMWISIGSVSACAGDKSDACQSPPTVTVTVLFCFKKTCELDTSCIRPSPILGKVISLLI